MDRVKLMEPDDSPSQEIINFKLPIFLLKTKVASVSFLLNDEAEKFHAFISFKC